MSFNSLEFAVFFAIFFVLYWFVTNRNLKLQNGLILVFSYIFYGWWDERFLALIAISSLADYLIGLQMGKTTNDKVRLRYLFLSLAVNLGILGFFKYFNFFLDNLNGVTSLLGMSLDWPTLNIILPVGISFYTLQTLSYTFDVYKKKIEPTADFLAFFAYVSFFPQLVAGPIERATQLLPQFQKPRVFDYALAADGARQVLWGLFMKMVIADNIGPYVDANYFNPEDFNTMTIWFMAYMGVVQMYCDFAGYSNIAIGTARIFGFDLMKNFDYPLFSRNISEFWQKWHISLITWLRDYVIVWFKGISRMKVIRNIFVIFFIAGLWHGADWRYIIWGVGNALWFLPLLLGKRKKYRKGVAHGKMLPSFSELLAMFWVVTQFTLVGIMFRGFSVQNSWSVYQQAVNFSAFGLPVIPDWRFGFILILFAVEWWQREQDHGLDFTRRKLPAYVRWPMYLLLIFITLLYGGQANDFIYFQF